MFNKRRPLINVVRQWFSRWILNPFFPGSSPGCRKVDSALHHSEDGKMSRSVNNAAQVCRGCVYSVRDRVHTAGAGMCHRLGL